LAVNLFVISDIWEVQLCHCNCRIASAGLLGKGILTSKYDLFVL